ncbi:MAG TPA: DMT family transporter [Firmicutes bacterium]|nr:DMT family transporter [Bacillota bacterium]
MAASYDAKSKERAFGHMAAVFTILLWGTTFISTKVLLRDLSPIEILFYRFLLGYFALWLVCPKVFRLKRLKDELLFMAAGLCGVTLYFLLENIALTYTFASNVSLILSAAPFFTALAAHCFFPGERLTSRFFLGFLAAMAGVILITFNGAAVLRLNPLGDLLAVLAAVVWAFYSVCTKKIGVMGFCVVQTTRRIFFYGLIFMIPTLFFFDASWDLSLLKRPENFLNIIYLGLGASAMCFVSWNRAVEILGAVKTSAYIYATPIVTIITARLILDESLTPLALVGTGLILLGLFLSERRKPLSPEVRCDMIETDHNIETK